MKVAVLGCGPAGLLAAHAAGRAGADLVIYSDKAEPSRIGGAQFLHRAIPGITYYEPDDQCDFRHLGTREAYAKKVYGDPNADVSWGSYPEGDNPVWNMQRAYNSLWEQYAEFIVVEEVNSRVLLDISRQNDVVFSCIPAPALCNHGGSCLFTSQQVWIQQRDNHFKNLRCSIVYNGFADQDWYRWSSLFGTTFFEYPSEVANSFKVSKPLWTNCPGPTYADNVIRLGRYGLWEKHQLIHHAYEGAERALH